MYGQLMSVHYKDFKQVGSDHSYTYIKLIQLASYYFKLFSLSIGMMLLTLHYYLCFLKTRY